MGVMLAAGPSILAALQRDETRPPGVVRPAAAARLPCRL